VILSDVALELETAPVDQEAMIEERTPLTTLGNSTMPVVPVEYLIWSCPVL